MKNEENWLAFFSELQAYIEAHGHLPDKHVVENRGLLSKAKYLRKKIKAGTAEDWMVEKFIEILAMRTKEHTGGKRKKIVPNNNTSQDQDNIVNDNPDLDAPQN